MPDITRPDGEQIRFRSAKTGEHSLDEYLEDAEFGERPLADILQGVFDTDTGNVRQGLVEFRLNTTTRELESRAGVFGDPDEGFAGTGAFFSRFQGDWASGVQYRASDYVRISGTTYLVTEDHISGVSPDMSKFLDLLASPTLAAIGAATGAGANKLLYFTAADTTEFADFTAFGRSLVAAASASATRTLLGLGAAATASLAAFPATTMGGTLTLAADPALALQAATKQYVDNGLALKADPLGFTPVNRNGDTLTGFLTAHAAPTATLHVATKGYVDTTLTNLVNGKVSKTGDTMSGALTINSTLNVTGLLTGAGADFGALSANLTHKRGGGYLTIGSYNVATYGDGDGRLWWREDIKELTLAPAAGGVGTLRAGYFNINVQALGTASDSTAAPSFSWTGDTNTGFYHADAATIGVAVGGAGTWFFSPTGGLANTLSPPTFGSIGKLSLAGTTATFTSTLTLSRTSDDATSAVIRFGKSRSTVIGNYAAVQTGDELGSIIWYGADGVDGNGIGARIRAVAGENHTTTKSGSYLDFGTTAIGSNTFGSRLTIDDASADFTVRLKVTEGTATGMTANSAADTLVLDVGGSGGITVLTTDTGTGALYFGDTAANTAGGINYAHSTDTLTLRAGSATRLSISGTDITLAAGVELSLVDVGQGGVFSAGYRGMPAVASNAARNFTLNDCGKCVYKNNTTAYTYTIDPDATTAYPVGAAIMVLNDGTAGNITVARGAGVALVNSAGTNANVTVAPNSNVTLYKVSANRWRALGA